MWQRRTIWVLRTMSDVLSRGAVWAAKQADQLQQDVVETRVTDVAEVTDVANVPMETAAWETIMRQHNAPPPHWIERIQQAGSHRVTDEVNRPHVATQPAVPTESSHVQSAVPSEQSEQSEQSEPSQQVEKRSGTIPGSAVSSPHRITRPMPLHNPTQIVSPPSATVTPVAQQYRASPRAHDPPAMHRTVRPDVVTPDATFTRPHEAPALHMSSASPRAHDPPAMHRTVRPDVVTPDAMFTRPHEAPALHMSSASPRAHDPPAMHRTVRPDVVTPDGTFTRPHEASSSSITTQSAVPRDPVRPSPSNVQSNRERVLPSAAPYITSPSSPVTQSIYATKTTVIMRESGQDGQEMVWPTLPDEIVGDHATQSVRPNSQRIADEQQGATWSAWYF